MARVNIDILEISELKWTGMDGFNSDDQCMYYCRQESLRRNGVVLIVNKTVQNGSTWVQFKKWQNDSCSFPGKPFNITAIQFYATTTNAEEPDVEWFYEDLQDVLELTHKQDVPFIIGDWNAKVGSRDKWSNRQVWPWGTKWSRAKANRVLPRELGHSKLWS